MEIVSKPVLAKGKKIRKYKKVLFKLRLFKPLLPHFNFCAIKSLFRNQGAY